MDVKTEKEKKNGRSGLERYLSPGRSSMGVRRISKNLIIKYKFTKSEPSAVFDLVEPVLKGQSKTSPSETECEKSDKFCHFAKTDGNVPNFDI